MNTALENLLQQVMSRFMNFTVTELSKLLGVENYHSWVNIVMSRIRPWRCYLDLYLNDQFMDIPGVLDSDPIQQNLLRVLYDQLVDLLMSKYLPDALLERYTAKDGLSGVALWQILYTHFGTLSFQQRVHLKSNFYTKLRDSTLSLTEMIRLF